jgi:hypothetical protein
LEYFKNESEKLSQVQWDKWFYEPGMPVVENKFDTTLAVKALDLAEKWFKEKDCKEDDLKDWHSAQISKLENINILKPFKSIF